MLPLASDTKTILQSEKHLHYSTVIYEMSQTSQPTENEDFSQNYEDVSIASRPSFTVPKTWPSSFSSTSSPLSLTHDDMDLLEKLQKARYNSNRHLPPLPKSPKRTYYRNTSSYNNCKTFL